MKLVDTLIFSFSILFLLISIHQSMTVGFAASYWLFMVTFGLLIWFQRRKKNRAKQETEDVLEKKDKKRKYKM